MYGSKSNTKGTSGSRKTGRDGGDNATGAILPQTRVPYVRICYQGHRDCDRH
ncbi:hypothetical protein ACQEVF_59635 [Nonomuraea polychroma]|uniref:hypothetical protein n=1 Tax=Nonomuraea polychroma TaxID=46176 RepID=UPI003D8D5FD4